MSKNISINALLKLVEQQQTTSALTDKEYDLFTDRGCYHFYDWFCSNSSLRNRFLTLIKKVKLLVEHKIINGDTTYVWFKNNAPVDHPLYDDIRFSMLRTENDGKPEDFERYLGGFAPKHPFYDNGCHFFLIIDSAVESVDFDSYKEFKQALKAFSKGEPNEKIQALKNHFYKE